MEVCLFSSLKLLRNEINKIDDNIVQLIANRIDIVKDIAKIKLQLELPIRNESVEKEKLNRLTDLALKINISPNLISAIYSLLINYAIRIQEDEINQLNWNINPNEILSKDNDVNLGAESL